MHKKCPIENCDRQFVPASLRFHLIRVHGMSREEADAAMESDEPVPDPCADSDATSGEPETPTDNNHDPEPKTDTDADNGINTEETEEPMRPEEIKKIRKDNDMTQKEFADALGVSDACIYAWEHGKWSPNEESRSKLEALRYGELERAAIEDNGDSDTAETHDPTADERSDTPDGNGPTVTDAIEPADDEKTGEDDESNGTAEGAAPKDHCIGIEQEAELEGIGEVNFGPTYPGSPNEEVAIEVDADDRVLHLCVDILAAAGERQRLERELEEALADE